MYFIGREREISRISSALASGKNVIIYGKFGIGRTALANQVAKLNQKKLKFLYVDFSQTPEKVCQQIFKELFPESCTGKKRIGYKKMRQQIVDISVKEDKKFALVLDNIEKITHQRIEFLRYLFMKGQFLFIGIVENFLSQNDLLRLRSVLHLNCQIKLSYLKLKEVEHFFRFYSDKFHLDWTETEIKNYSRMTKGYPLFLTEKIKKLLSDSKKNIFLA